VGGIQQYIKGEIMPQESLIKGIAAGESFREVLDNRIKRLELELIRAINEFELDTGLVMQSGVYPRRSGTAENVVVVIEGMHFNRFSERDYVSAPGLSAVPDVLR